VSSQVTLDNPLAHPLTFGRSADFSSSMGSPTHAMSVVQTSAPPHMLQAPGAAAPLGAAAAPACDLRTLFFGHVPDRVQEQELIHLFSRCGPVVDVVLFKQFPKSKYSRVSLTAGQPVWLSSKVHCCHITHGNHPRLATTQAMLMWDKILNTSCAMLPHCEPHTPCTAVVPAGA